MVRKQKKYHYIYKTTCNITNKYYIGMHSTNNLEDGYIGSGKRLWFSIKYYGKETHTKDIIEFCEDRITLAKREREIVGEDILCDKMCMNLAIGGDGGRGFTIEEQKLNAKKSHAKQKILRETNKEWVNNKRINMSRAQKRAYKEGRAKIVPNWSGMKHSEETKQKMSVAKKRKYDGKNNPSFGTCWITNSNSNKKIKKDDLDFYLANGWIKGRKIKIL